ncbi:MAG: hypothetical protein V4671_27570 [Armatimonadota bacterium]
MGNQPDETDDENSLAESWETYRNYRLPLYDHIDQYDAVGLVLVTKINRRSGMIQVRPLEHYKRQVADNQQVAVVNSWALPFDDLFVRGGQYLIFGSMHQQSVSGSKSENYGSSIPLLMVSGESARMPLVLCDGKTFAVFTRNTIVVPENVPELVLEKNQKLLAPDAVASKHSFWSRKINVYKGERLEEWTSLRKAILSHTEV